MLKFIIIVAAAAAFTFYAYPIFKSYGPDEHNAATSTTSDTRTNTAITDTATTTTTAVTSTTTGQKSATAANVILSGEMYGGCNRTYVQCGHFTLNADQSYSYQPAHARGDAPAEPKTGQLSAASFQEIEQNLATANFSVLQEPSDRCRSALDGTDYRYHLWYKNKEYILDTCGTKFGTSALAQRFLTLWSQVKTAPN